jgi:hypothetical protein
MGWCYCVEIDITLPSSALATIEKRRAGEVARPRRWSGLHDAALEASLGRPLSSGESFVEALRWFSGAHPGLASAQQRQVTGSTTRLHIVTRLDSSLLGHAFPLVALFHATCEAGGTGALRLVDDGTEGARGAALRIEDGRIVRTRFEEDWALADRIDAALAAPASAPTSKASKATTKASKATTKASKATTKASKATTKASKATTKVSKATAKASGAKRN